MYTGKRGEIEKASHRTDKLITKLPSAGFFGVAMAYENVAMRMRVLTVHVYSETTVQ